jgi:biotin operon repressor
MTRNSNFYLPILNELKTRTNLSKIKEKLSISKQNLQYHLRELKKQGFIIQKGRGWYELTNKVKDSTKYGKLLVKDMSRGHGYIWELKLPQEMPQGWNKRIEILTNKGIHFNLVGALKTTPRIKVSGRKVWLCNNHLRVFDKPNQSYYGKTAIESRKYAMQEIILLLQVLETKLGVSLNVSDIYHKKEHYALIKNDLAIEHNKRGELIHISDKEGEWLLCDDSLEQGGELETIGKKSLVTNVKLQKWWNDKKEHNFKITDTFLLERMNQVTDNQMAFAQNLISHIEAIKTLSESVKELKEEVKRLRI